MANATLKPPVRSSTKTDKLTESMSTPDEVEQFLPIDPDKVRVGEMMAITHYVRVVKTSNQTSGKPIEDVSVEDLDRPGKQFMVQGRDLIGHMTSADQSQETRSVTRTQMAETLMTLFGRPFTVTFVKQDGSERVLRGRLIRPEPVMGRSMVEDLDVKGAERVRQVDHRTLLDLTVGCVLYVLK